MGRGKDRNTNRGERQSDQKEVREIVKKRKKVEKGNKLQVKEKAMKDR